MTEAFDAEAPARPSRWTGTWPTNAAWIVLGALTGAVLLIGTTAPTGRTWRDAVAEDPTTVIGVATLCYLAAAATGLRWMAWLMALLASALPVATQILDLPVWLTFGAVGVVLVGLGVARGRSGTTWPQAAAMAGFIGVATVAIYLEPRAGLALAGLALAAHAVWDLAHYRRDIVVNRSLALWCIGLDLTLGGICVALAL